MKVYQGGQIQHVNDYGKGWRNRLKQKYDHIEWIDPLDKYSAMEEAKSEWTVEEVVEDDFLMIVDCDAILVHWQETATCGTPMEVFFAKWFPAMADMLWSVTYNMSNEHALREKDRIEWTERALREEVERVGLPRVVADMIIAVKTEITVVVQTTVEDPSPWLTYHADVMVESFDEAVTALEMVEGYQQI